MMKLGAAVVCVIGLCVMWCAAQDKTTTEQRDQTGFRKQLGSAMFDGGDFPLLQSQMMRELGLTKEQQQQIQRARVSSTNEMTVLRAKLECALKREIELISADDPKEDEIMKQVDEITLHTRDMAKIRVKQVLVGLKVLTPEQRNKMRELVKARLEKRKQEEKDKRARMEKRRSDAGKREPARTDDVQPQAVPAS